MQLGQNIEKFSGSNFPMWKLRVEMLLKKLEVWVVISTPDLRSKEFTKKNEEALYVIISNVTDSVLPTIAQHTSASEAWISLVHTYESKSVGNIILLRRQFYRKNLNADEEMISHINNLKSLALQLNSAGSKITNEELAYTVLSSLPEDYDNLVQSLSSADHLNIETVTQRLLCEESRRKDKQALVEPAALVSKAGKKKWKCTYCKKNGHTADRCWSKPENDQSDDSENPVGPRESKISAPSKAYTAETNNLNKQPEVYSWYIDSGASFHMCCDLRSFTSHETIPDWPVTIANGEKINAKAKGTVILLIRNGSEFSHFSLSDVLYVPDFKANLISVGRLSDKGVTLRFYKSHCELIGSGYSVKARRNGDLYEIKALTKSKANLASASIEVWHRRLGHLDKNAIKKMATENLVNGLEEVSLKENCEECVLGKQHKMPFPSSMSSSKQPLELIHSDVVGPIEKISIGGNRYIVTFLDDFSKYTTVYFLKTKSEVIRKFKTYKALAENFHNAKIKVFRSDGGGEFCSREFENLLQESGIEHHKSAPYTPQQNGSAERLNRTLFECGRSILAASELPEKFWADAVATAVHAKNRSLHKAIGRTPFELWTGEKPDLGDLRIFGCAAYAITPNNKRKKLTPKSTKCVFIGYEPGMKAYRLYDCKSQKIIVSREVIFDESKFVVANKNQPQPIIIQQNLLNKNVELPADGSTKNESLIINDSGSSENTDAFMEEMRNISKKMREEDPNEKNERVKNIIRRMTRPQNTDEIRPDEISAMIAQSLEDDDPDSVKAAMECGEAEFWKKAMDDEMASIVKNSVFELTDLPPGRKTIGSKWIFKRKLESNKNVRFKARLVAQGYAQEKGIDYSETFAPVARFSSIRVILSIAANQNWTLNHMDVKTAFLNGDLCEEIYLKEPQGYSSNPSKVWRLKKALYGLKQAPRSWNIRLHTFLVDQKFSRCESDHSVYTKNSERPVVIVVYVDDLLIAAADPFDAVDVKKKLSETFEMKDLGPVTKLLGIDITRNLEERTISLSQQEYVERILKEFGMEQSKSCGTPQAVGVKLSREMCPTDIIEKKEMEKVPYANLIGGLMYLVSWTRPDIANAVANCSKYMSNPGNQHWTAAKRILRYLRGTSGRPLILGGKSDLKLVGYCDADWAGDHDDRRSTTGYLFVLGGLITWKSRKQKTVALSTAEAEYMAAADAAKEAVWISQLVRELRFPTSTIPILCDNQSCIALTKDPGNHDRTKHIDIRLHFIRDLVANEKVTFIYCPTEDMLADGLTKPVPLETNRRLTDLMELSPLDLSGSVRKLSRGRPHDSQALKNLGVIGSCSHEGSSLDPCAAA